MQICISNSHVNKWILAKYSFILQISILTLPANLVHIKFILFEI